jgi:hypothetical protein
MIKKASRQAITASRPGHENPDQVLADLGYRRTNQWHDVDYGRICSVERN